MSQSRAGLAVEFVRDVLEPQSVYLLKQCLSSGLPSVKNRTASQLRGEWAPCTITRRTPRRPLATQLSVPTGPTHVAPAGQAVFTLPTCPRNNLQPTMAGVWKVNTSMLVSRSGGVRLCTRGPRQDYVPAVHSDVLLDNTPFLGFLPFPDSLPRSLTGIS